LTSESFLNINRIMAIRRCPYCKAIIDEGSEYCSNCGTQLLFPEDEYIHEEVPGEKIVEEDAPEEGNPKKEKSSSRRRKKKEEQQELEPVETEEDVEPVPEEEIEGEVEFEPMEEGKEEEIGEEEIQKPPEPERDEFFVEVQEPAFGTEDLEKVIDPEEKEKAEIEKFLKSLKEDRDEWDGEIPPTDELPPWAEKIKDAKPDEMPVVSAESEEDVQEFEESKEDLPVEEEITVDEEPPAEELPMEESPLVVEEEQKEVEEVLKPMGLTPEDEVPEVQIPHEEQAEEEIGEIIAEEIAAEESVKEEIAEDEVPEEESLEEETPEEEDSMPDTGMGLPEGVDQEKLPFVDTSTGEFDEEEETPPSKLSSWIKSRAFDVLFIAALWIVALHIASRILSTNLFKLISVSVLPVVAFYLTLLAVYLFLFFLFLGQTLGDQLFPYEE
jgi:hypothetical protein